MSDSSSHSPIPHVLTEEDVTRGASVIGSHS